MHLTHPLTLRHSFAFPQGFTLSQRFTLPQGFTLSLTLAVLWLQVLSAPQVLAEDSLSDYASGEEDASQAIEDLLNTPTHLIQFPPGKFILSRTIDIHLDKVGFTAIRGSAATTIVNKANGPAFRFIGTHFKSADPSGVSDQTWKNERMPQIQDLAIEGASEHADGIEAIGTMQLTVSRVHLRKLRHGIRLVKNNRNILIDSCHIYENRGVGIYYDDVNLHQSNITGCHISYCGQGGIVSKAGNVRNIHITGCDLESNMSADEEPTANVLIDCRGSHYGTAEVAITGCTIQHNDRGPDSSNIRIIGNSDPTPQLPEIREGHVTITGNILSDVQHNIWLSHCRGVTITGNTFWMGFEHNLLVENSSHIICGTNNLDRNPRYAYGHATESKNQVLFRDCEKCTLTGMHLATVQGGPAITLKDCHQMHLHGLTILDSEPGILLEGVHDSRVADCFIRSDGDSNQRIVQIRSTNNHIQAENE